MPEVDFRCRDGTLAHHLVEVEGCWVCKRCNQVREMGEREKLTMDQLNWERGFRRSGYRKGWMTGLTGERWDG